MKLHGIISPGLHQALHRARSDGYDIDIYDDLVLPRYDAEYHSHGFYVTNMNTEYTRRLEGWLRSGWTVFAEIDLYGSGAYVDDRVNSPAHIVLLDGTREGFDRVSDVASRMEHYIHVVCSAKGSYWIKTQDLLRKHGAAGWKLIRKK